MARQPKGLIRIGVGIDRFVDKLSRGGSDILREAIEDTLEEVRANAQASWPVRQRGISQGSRELWIVEIEEDPTRIVGELVNRSGYATFINGGVTIDLLVVKPFRTEVSGLPFEFFRRFRDL